MSVTSTEIQNPNHRRESDEAVDRALIDASARFPVLAFFASAIFWLLVQTVFGLIASYKVLSPEFLANCSWLTYGNVFSARNGLMMYGWASMAGLGTCIWIMARICKVQLPRPATLVGGIALWNIGVLIGLVEVLAGNSRGFLFLEFPVHVFAILFVAYAIIAVWGVLLFVGRRPGHVYISAWYLVAALFWFPWLIGGANLLVGSTGNGVFDAISAAWFAQCLINLWLTAIGLGAIYYLIPKVVGRPIHSYYLASVGFWTFAFFAVWAGTQRLNGGPVPAWIITVGIVAAILMLIPVALVTANYFMTMRGKYNLVYHSPTIRFVFFGAIAYTLANIVYMISSFRSIGDITSATWFTMGVDQLFIYAFFTMVMFGAIYYIVPRLVGCEWLSAGFIKLHFWGTAYGFGLGIVMLLLAGYSQGHMQAQISQTDAVNVHADFMLSVFAYLPFFRGHFLASLILLLGQLIFAFHFLLMLLRLGRPSGTQPTLFEPIHEGTKP